MSSNALTSKHNVLALGLRQVALGSGYVFAAQNEQCLAALQPEEWQHMLEQGRWQAPNRVELNELRVDRRNPNFSLFFPAHFARFWTRNPAEVRRAAWARGLGGECAGSD